MASYDKKVAEVIAKDPKNATYTSPQIQKEILHVFSMKVMNAIREEISDAEFCIIVDEARDESVREQMAVVLRFVDNDGFVRERFFGVAHVFDTVALTLKKEIYSLLSRYNLDIQNIRGQGVITPFLPSGFSRVSTRKTRQPKPSRPDPTRACHVK